jgi:predicted nucleic acid-binding protein
MNYVLDTNVVSETLKASPDPVCDAWLERNIEQCCITTITLAEFRYGVERLAEGKRKRDLDRKLDFLWQEFGERIFDFDSAAAAEFGRYVAEFESSRGQQAVASGDVRDFQIAAIARAHGWPVATRNIRHYSGIRCVDPFQR